MGRRAILYGRRGGFAPGQIAGLRAWFRADEGVYQDSARTTAAAADGDPVGGWEDLSGSGNHLAQATAAKRATLKLAIQNGRPVVRFDGVDDFLQKNFTALGQPTTVFVVASRPSADDRAVFDGGAGGGNRHTIRRSSGIKIAAGVELSHATFNAGFHVLCARFNGASSFLRMDGAEVIAPANAGAQALDGISLGAYFSEANPAAIDHGEVLLYHAALTAAEIGQVEAYLNQRWAVF